MKIYELLFYNTKLSESSPPSSVANFLTDYCVKIKQIIGRDALIYKKRR